jgi:two-component system response regulator CpxR
VPQAARLLIIDDDRGLCELLGEYLGSVGFETHAAHDSEEGLRRAMSGEYDLAILDVMLPGGSGFELLRRIRGQCSLPVLMLTARGEEIDRIVGLEIGADDYLPKPFNPRELAARLHAILRRVREPDAGRAADRGVVAVDDVELDFGARTVRRGGQLIELTGTEFELLGFLLRCAGRVVAREELSQRILGRRLQPFDRSIDMHVSHLRRKLGPGREQPERIRGVRGVGYVYVTTRADSRPSQSGRAG